MVVQLHAVWEKWDWTSQFLFSVEMVVAWLQEYSQDCFGKEFHKHERSVRLLREGENADIFCLYK